MSTSMVIEAEKEKKVAGNIRMTVPPASIKSNRKRYKALD